METLAVILGGLAALIGIVLLVQMFGRFRALQEQLKTMQESQKGDQGMVMLNQNVQQLQQTMHQSMQEQFGQSAKIIQDVTDRLARLDETNKQVLNFSEQLQDLQDILKNPKQRGAIGEYYLETVLKNVLPPGSYQMQYAFKDGEIVDAIVRVKDRIIPIDSKFSLENYNRLLAERDAAERSRIEKVFVNDLKLRIQETGKYIRPAEGTMEFAFMFIPSEAIYYDLLTNKVGAVQEETENLVQRAASKYHVIIVSPTSFLAYLQTVLQGLRALQIEESAKEIRSNVDLLRKHLQVYAQNFGMVGTNLGKTLSSYEKASKEFTKIDKDVLKIAGTSVDYEPPSLEKPESE